MTGTVQSYLKAAANAPSAYSEFILKNASAVSQIESGLRSLTYIVPGRFRESEIASESLYSGVNLLGMYHDSLLSKAAAALPSLPKQHQTPRNRYTRYWTKKSPLYRRVALLLQVIQYIELLCEMTAKRKGEQVRWRTVVILETVKALCRLILLRLTKSRPLLSPPLPERIDPSLLEAAQRPASEQAESPPSETSEDIKWTMPRTGLSLPALPESSDISSYLLSKVLTADDVKPPKALLHPVSGKSEIAEWMYILRPVVYALAVQRWGQDKSDWRPWLIGFAIEYGARQLAKRDFRERFSNGLHGLTKLERDELSKRGWGLAWWAMRGAFYENITKSWVHSFANGLKNKPLLDLAATVVEDYEFLWSQYYFATATM